MATTSSGQRMQNPTDLYRHAPLRTPHWRWDCASAMVGEDQQPAEGGDADIATAIDFLRIRRKAGLSTVRRVRPVTAIALSIWEHDQWLRWEVEGRILADQPPAELAATMDLPLEVVASYEQLFFDARPGRSGSSWIFGRALDLRGGDAEKPPQRALWQLVGWAGGVEAMDTVAGDQLLRPCEDRAARHTEAEWIRLHVRLLYLLLTARMPRHEVLARAAELCEQTTGDDAATRTIHRQLLALAGRKGSRRATAEEIRGKLTKVTPHTRPKSKDSDAAPQQKEEVPDE